MQPQPGARPHPPRSVVIARTAADGYLIATEHASAYLPDWDAARRVAGELVHPLIDVPPVGNC